MRRRDFIKGIARLGGRLAACRGRAAKSEKVRRVGMLANGAGSQFLSAEFGFGAKPVALPPGCARLCTRPMPTGSVTAAKTIQIVRVRFCNANTLGFAIARMTSGASPTNSFAFSRNSSSSLPKRAIDLQIRARSPTKVLQGLPENPDARCHFDVRRVIVVTDPENRSSAPQFAAIQTVAPSGQG